MLFDERRRPYMLMLQQFELSKAQDALFSALEWTLDLINRQSLTTDDQQTSQLNNTYDASPTEFLNSALMLILRLVNVKSILESPHSIPKNTQAERSYDLPLHYLALTHKHAFHLLTSSCSVLYDKSYLLKDHATEIIDSILSIFCHILHGELQQQQNLSTLMDFSPEHAIQDLLQRTNNLELVGDYCISHSQAAITGMMGKYRKKC
jgi:E3 ubiquitin-protein ligase HUWE1